MGNGRGWNCICQRVYAALSRVDDRRIIGGIVHVLRSAPEYGPHMISISPGAARDRDLRRFNPLRRQMAGLQLGDHRGGGCICSGCAGTPLRAEVAAAERSDAAPSRCCTLLRQTAARAGTTPRKSTGNTSSPPTGRTASRRIFHGRPGAIGVCSRFLGSPS